MLNNNYPIVMEEISDPHALAQAKTQRQQYDRNTAWWQAHATELYSQYRGKCVCISGEEFFVADTAKESLELATRAHPSDEGRIVLYIPKDKVARIYAH